MDNKQHSRRAFLQGEAAAQALVDQARQLLETAAPQLAPLAPSEPAWHVRASRRAMACEFAVQYHVADRSREADILAAFDEVEAVEDRLTIYRSHSEVRHVNRLAATQPVEVSRALFELLTLCQKLHQTTDGAFDITSTPLSRVWGFLERAGRRPADDALARARQAVGWQHLQLDCQRRTVRFSHPDLEINFNSIGKGYALDRAARLLDRRGVTDYLWHGGKSSILARGSNRADDRPGWTVALRHPAHPRQMLAELHLQDRALGTAGGATQGFQLEGQRLSHIIDPRTGWPATGVLTATALSPTGAEADALATAFFVAGVEATTQYCLSHPHIGAVLVCPAKRANQVTVHALNLHEDDWTPHGDPTGVNCVGPPGCGRSITPSAGELTSD